MLVRIIFDGPPGPQGGHFVEVEDMDGRGVSVGKWVQLPDGMWALQVSTDEINHVPAAHRG